MAAQNPPRRGRRGLAGTIAGEDGRGCGAGLWVAGLGEDALLIWILASATGSQPHQGLHAQKQSDAVSPLTQDNKRPEYESRPHAPILAKDSVANPIGGSQARMGDAFGMWRPTTPLDNSFA